MIYAVNLKTKEHRRDDGIKSDDEVWLMADDDGWVEWESHGQHEPLPDGQLCEIKLSDGEVLRIRDPETWDWTQGGDQWIVAYRPILDADTKSEPSAWDGEGLPPVGCECEVLHDGEWVGCEILAHYRPCSDGPMAAVYAYAIEDGRKVAQKIKSQFRPIRSEEEIAAEIEMNEASKMIRDARAQGMRRDNEYDTCRALYRAGYRRTEDDA